MIGANVTALRTALDHHITNGHVFFFKSFYNKGLKPLACVRSDDKQLKSAQKEKADHLPHAKVNPRVQGIP